MGSGNAGKGMGAKRGHQDAGPAGPDTIDAEDLADEAHGRNRLQANDQGNVHHQRAAMPGRTVRTEGTVEAFERMDPKVRAGRDAGDRSRGK